MSGKELRLRRLFPRPGARLFAVPLDHSLTMGPIKGLTHLGPVVEALQEGGVRAFIVHKGAVRSINHSLRPSTLLGIHLSASTNLGPEPGRKHRSGTVAEAVRLGADFVSVQVNFGDPSEGSMLEDLGATSEEAHALGMPLLCMAYVRKKGSEYDAESLAHACRAAADLGADIVKTNFPGRDGFRRLIQSTPVPVLIGGGKNIEREEELLTLVRDSLQGGGRGLCIGRSFFQSADPTKLAKKVQAILQEFENAAEAPPAAPAEVHPAP